MKKLKGYAPLVIRIVLGSIFVKHGWGKVRGMWGYFLSGNDWGFIQAVGFMDFVPLLPPVFWAICATLAEFFGGVSVFLGLKERWGAAFIGIVMIAAIFGVHLPQGDSIEFQVALLGMAVSLILSGAGKFNVEIKK